MNENESRLKPAFSIFKKEIDKFSHKDKVGFCERVYNCSLPSLGIKIPDIRNLAKYFSDFPVSMIPLDVCFEYNLLFFIIGLKQISDIREQTDFIIENRNHFYSWAITDTSYGLYKRLPLEEELRYLLKLKRKGSFAQRFSYVVLLKYCKEKDISSLLSFIEDSKLKEVYTSIGWLLAECLIYHQEEVLSYVESSSLSYKTIQVFAYKARDSFRIESSVKIRCKELLNRKKDSLNQ